MDRVENIMYNLLMTLNIVLSNGLIISKNKRIQQLMKKFDMTGIYLSKVILSGLNLDLDKANLEVANFNPIILKNAILKGTKISRNRYNEIVALGIDINNIIWYDLASRKYITIE